MISISAGAIVTVRQFGNVAWVVHRRVADGRFKCIGKAVDDRGGEALSSRTAGEGDVMLITPAPIYEAGTLIERGGVQYTVATDLGDHVELIVPATRFPLKGGGALHLPGGNTITVAKSALTVEALK